MRSVFLLAAANLRRHKSAALSLGLLALIAALVLNLGMLGFTGCSSFIDSKTEELHTQSFSAVFPNQFGDSRLAFFKNLISESAGVKETQSENVLFFPFASFSLKSSGSYENKVIFESTDACGNMGRFQLIVETGRPSDNAIYVPYILKTKGYQAGDNFTLTYMGKDYSFIVAGFTEDILLGSLNTGGIRFFLPDSAYQKLAGQLNAPETQAVMLSARTNTKAQASDISVAITKPLAQNPADVMRTAVLSINTAEFAASMPVEIGAAMEVGFALIVALVLLLVVRFRIVNSIEQEMQNIGALGALGYTAGQVRGGYMLQFLATSVVGSAMGIALSYAVAGPYSQMLAFETGINWTQPFNMAVNLITLVIMIACVLLVAFLATRHLKKLPVIVALRGGITTHSFRKNRLPLVRTRGPLNVLLALKSSFANARQNVALVIILVFVSFASVFVYTLYYNFSVDNTVVVRTLGDETNDIIIGAKSVGDAKTLLQELPKTTDITQAIDDGYATLTIDGQPGRARISEDYGKFQNNQCYKGRYPGHDNEVALGGKLAVQLHKDVGDTVSITLGTQSSAYLITGLTQSMNTMGLGFNLTDDGMRRLNPQYEPAMVLAYVAKSANVDNVISQIRTQYGAMISAITNARAAYQNSFGTYTSIVAIFAVAIFAVMGLIVVLILTLITGATIVRRRREFGIEKALGFTAWQLICQVSIGFLPVAVIGALIGGVLGGFEANSLMSLLFRSVGVMKVDFYLPPLSIPVICAVIAILTIAVSMLSAGRVRKISPCVLVSE